jgi:phospholipid/cholesterol/gamma-HCH transport system substrate-binding protein
VSTRSAGIRFLAFAVVTGVLTFLIGASIMKFSFGNTYTLTAEFDDVSGLFLGDDVRIAGVPIGKVSSIETEAGRAVIALEIKAAREIPDDSEITVSWLNLIGQRQVDILPGESPTFFEDGQRMVNTIAVTDIGTVADQLGPFSQVLNPAQINELLETVYLALQGREGDVAALATDVAEVLSTLAERDDTIQGLISDYSTVTSAVAERDVQIRTMVDNLLVIAETFAESDDVLAAALDDAGVLSEELNGFLQRNEATLSRIIEDLAGITDIAVDRLDTLETIVNELPAAGRDLFSATRRGEFLNIDFDCLQFSLPPCLTPIEASEGSEATTSRRTGMSLEWLMLGGDRR